MGLGNFRKLGAKERALVCIAVLLDGREAPLYLENDITQGDEIEKSARELSVSTPEIRMPLVGTLLREALEEIASKH